MRTRSTRFFVVLLHLVGVSRDLPSSLQQQGGGGIAGAADPWPYVLEEINLFLNKKSGAKKRGTRTGSTSRRKGASTTTNVDKPMAVWLQDASDGSCLGPTARFVECGDAAQWIMAPRRSGRKRLRMGLFGVNDYDAADEEEEEEGRYHGGWMFQVPSEEHTDGIKRTASSRSSRRSWRRRRRSSECLYSNDGTARVDRCYQFFNSKGSTAAWIVDPEDGSLRPVPSERRRRLLGRQQPRREQRTPLCLWRALNDTSPATSIGLQNCSATLEGHRKVKFSLIRYQAVAAWATKSDAETDDSASEVPHDTPQPSPSAEPHHLPSSRDAAHVHANEPSVLHNPNSLSHATIQLNKQPKKQAMPLRVLHDTNPILLASGAAERRRDRRQAAARQQGSSMLPVATASSVGDVGALSPAMHKVRRIEMHPYIAAAKNEIWNDPQTNLQYNTDLCRYLGHDRKERGRHTLMGVGQYRKGYVVKVYGVAFYVSKRDSLSSPAMQPYASLSAEELRQRPDFYELLRTMDSSVSIDRTLLLKTNMQLSAETMRSSLQADWSYLTSEAKSTLIDSSMTARPADDAMLKIIRSPDNPSRCSCSQVAPEEYQGNPDCCARGTELAFTWLKSGNLEVRTQYAVGLRHNVSAKDVTSTAYFLIASGSTERPLNGVISPTGHSRRDLLRVSSVR